MLVDWLEGQTVLGKYPKKIRNLTVIALGVSLISILIGQFLSEKFTYLRRRISNEQKQIDVKDYLSKYGSILTITHIVFYITFPFSADISCTQDK